jgi:hypothetical protein
MFHRCSLLFLAQSSGGLHPLRGARRWETAGVVYGQFMSQMMHLAAERSMLHPRKSHLTPPESALAAISTPTTWPSRCRKCRKIWQPEHESDTQRSLFDYSPEIPIFSLQSRKHRGGRFA